MASKAYDHPAYVAPTIYSGGNTAGANSTTPKFAAFTAMKIKKIQIGIAVKGTSASTPLLYQRSGTSTTTSTYTALTSAAEVAVSHDVDITLAAGDSFWLTGGTDATQVLGVAFECYPIAGAELAQ
ncbi:MAG: hypothetical protein NUV51_08055 [Sulfuricaulis sp.]|nr:hypothetical protein [Sulfuricaulis sp.]